MASFDLLVVGCGGGPSEDNLSSYLLKAADVPWEEGIVALEAGSGLGAMTRLLDAHPAIFMPEKRSESESESESEQERPITTATDVYSRIRCYLITHAHLDHVNGMVLPAGSVPGPPKLVHGARATLEGVATIFAGEVWPKLATWEHAEQPGCLLLSPLPPEGGYTSVARDISVRMMPITHGENQGVPHPCTAYLVRNDSKRREFLFFGDVEPDTVSLEPHNLEVWQAAAPKIPDTLSAIFIECSWPSGRADHLLYGHLSPEHLTDELSALAVEVAKSRERARSKGTSNGARKKKKRNHDSSPSTQGVLAGLRVYIIHCKEDIQHAFDRPIQQVIASQVRALVDAKELGAEIIAVEQGMHIKI